MRRIAQVPSGVHHGSEGLVVCYDSDHDSLPEMMFYTGTIHSWDPIRHEFWEHQGWNRFSLVFADTGVTDPEPVGIVNGNALPFAAGDVDADGLTDIVCINTEITPARDTVYNIVMTLESPDSFSYPCSLSWYARYSDKNNAIPQPTYFTHDLDQDLHDEILSITPTIGTAIWENTGNDSNELVWCDTVYGWRFAFGDFDMDGRRDFATGNLGSSGWVEVWECTGDDQYARVFRDTVLQPNGADVFTTRDIDGDGKPEFYVAFENVPRGKIYLYMWEADQVGSDVYHRTLVDSIWFSGTNWGRISECGDIDGDGIDECVWTTPDIIKVYKAVGDDDLQEVWHWNNDHGGFRSLVSAVYDINGDGYNELITAGNAKISVFEIEAVRLLSPNAGSYAVGDTASIHWATYSPPRCDSLSLFLRRDSIWHLMTIATGLPGTDTVYRWVVPASVPDTGRIVVKAYGPGWQYDMSDSVIQFTGGGVAEGTRNVPLQWALSVSPNPARGVATIHYDVPCPAQVRVCLFDATGRAVRTLSEGMAAPGRYAVRVAAADCIPEGVYYVTMQESGRHLSLKAKLVVQK